MSNRVEQLEATVSELESTIEGLTEELVETKERVRAVEAELDVDAADFVEAPAEPEVPSKEAEPDEIERAVEADKEGASEESENADGSGGLGDDIIVA